MKYIASLFSIAMFAMLPWTQNETLAAAVCDSQTEVVSADVQSPEQKGDKVESTQATKQDQEESVMIPTNNEAAANENIQASEVEKQVLTLTNNERSKKGLAPLLLDENLMKSAHAKSNDMAQHNYFSHTSPVYGSPFDQMKQFGVTYRSAAENIAKGQKSAEEVVQAWMESPGHRKNILTNEFTHIGIGYSDNGNVWTQQFIQK